MRTRFPTPPGEPLVEALPSACLSDTQILLILDGTLPLTHDTQAEDHIDKCEDCRALLIALLRTEMAKRADVD